MNTVICILIFLAGLAVGYAVRPKRQSSGTIQVWNNEGQPYLFLSLDISMNELADSDGKELSFKIDWSHFE